MNPKKKDLFCFKVARSTGSALLTHSRPACRALCAGTHRFQRFQEWKAPAKAPRTSEGNTDMQQCIIMIHNASTVSTNTSLYPSSINISITVLPLAICTEHSQKLAHHCNLDDVLVTLCQAAGVSYIYHWFPRLSRLKTAHGVHGMGLEEYIQHISHHSSQNSPPS